MYIIPETTITAAMVKSNNAIEVHDTYDEETTYALGDIRVYAERLWESLQDDNLGHAPDEPLSAWWVDVGPSNRAAFYDGKVITQTTYTGSLVIELEIGVVVNGLALFNVTGGTVRVEVVEDGEVVFDLTKTLVDIQDASNIWEYLFTEPNYVKEIVFPSIPGFSGSTIRITIGAEGVTSGLGKIIVGRSHYLGVTMAGSGPRLVDYSSVLFDPDFGDYTFVRRDYAKGAVFTVGMDPQGCARILNILTANRGRIVAAFPGEDMERYGLTAAGILGAFEPSLEHRGTIPVTIDIKGIT